MKLCAKGLCFSLPQLKPFPILVTYQLSKYHTHAAHCYIQSISPKHITQADALPTLLTVLTPLGARAAKAELSTASSSQALSARELMLAQSNLATVVLRSYLSRTDRGSATASLKDHK